MFSLFKVMQSAAIYFLLTREMPMKPASADPGQILRTLQFVAPH